MKQKVQSIRKDSTGKKKGSPTEIGAKISREIISQFYLKLRQPERSRRDSEDMMCH